MAIKTAHIQYSLIKQLQCGATVLCSHFHSKAFLLITVKFARSSYLGNSQFIEVLILVQSLGRLSRRKTHSLLSTGVGNLLSKLKYKQLSRVQRQIDKR